MKNGLFKNRILIILIHVIYFNIELNTNIFFQFLFKFQWVVHVPIESVKILLLKRNYLFLTMSLCVEGAKKAQ